MFRSKRIKSVFFAVLVLAGLSVALLVPRIQYEVIPAYEGQARYVAAAKADPSADLDAFYKKYVRDVYQDACGSDGLVNINPLSNVVASHPLGSLDELEQGVQALRKSDIVRIAKTALQKTSAVLPGSKVTLSRAISNVIQPPAQWIGQGWPPMNY